VKRVLYIVQHRMGRSPGQRFRCEQYLEYLEQNGYEITYSNLINEREDAVFYSKGNYLKKLQFFIKSFRRRLQDVKRAGDFDIIFIYREAFMIGTTYFEKKIARKCKNIILDFDDSIWLNDVSLGNSNLKWLKNPLKTDKIISLSKCIFAGNSYLATYALKFNYNIKIIPTTIDTDYHTSKIWEKEKKGVCIGWTGTATTLKHLETAIPVLNRIKQKFKESVYFKVIVNFEYQNELLEISSTPWKKETEIQDLCEIDIGIMPLPDDEWSKGKCGFKGLQYMALEIPTIMSPVGVNSEIISDGVNGFLAATEEEWVEKISALIESRELREKLGKAGRQTVVEKYSVEAWKERYLSYFNEIVILD